MEVIHDSSSTGAPQTPEYIITDKKLQKWVLVSASFAGFMAVLDGFIVNISLPTIAKFFNAGTSEISWVTMAYLLVLTSALLMFGKLADRIGIKKVFVTGYAVFTIGSFVCGISSSLPMLIGARCLQGVGSAMLYATAQAVLTRYLPITIRGWAFGIFSTVCALGVTMGAPIGGLITQFLSWHWIFLINVPVGIAAVIVSSKMLPQEKLETLASAAKGFDYAGSVLTFIFLGSLLYAISMGQELGWTSFLVIGLFVTSATALVLFVVREKSCADPLIDLNIFKNKSFSFSVLSQAFMLMIMGGVNFLTPFYLINARGLEPDKAGFVMLMYSVVFMLVSPRFGKLSDRFSPRILCILGLSSGAAASTFLAFTLKDPGLIWIFTYLAWFGMSYAMFVSPSNNLAFGLAPEEAQGVASSILKTATNLAQSLGLVLFETIFALSLPHTLMGQGLEPGKAGLTPEMLYGGFSNAFFFAVFIYLCGITCMALVSRKEYEKAVEKTRQMKVVEEIAG